MNRDIKEDLKDAGVQVAEEAAEEALTVLGKWLLKRPRIKRLLAKFGIKP